MSNSSNQKTIKSKVLLKGIGLHSGKRCCAIFKPAPENSGITFVRNDVVGQPTIKAHVDYVADVVRGTTLGKGDLRIYTIEHLLSALNGLEIDNLTIELDDCEPPVADGSAIDIYEALYSSGVVDQGAPKKYLKVDSAFEYSSNKSSIRIEPSQHFEIDCEISYDHPVIRDQHFQFKRGDNYRENVAPARTFCFDYEIEALKKGGLAKGGSLENAIVVGPTGIYNAGTPLRFSNEFVRHKVLDLMGDLMLLGAPLQARIVAKRCGHGHNIKFLKQILANQTAPLSI